MTKDNVLFSLSGEPKMTKFIDLPLSDQMQKALAELGFDTPTEIQEKAIPMLVADNNADFHGQAQTGTGKTLAFGIPLIEKIDPKARGVQALVIAPTRELVTQIVESLESVAKYKGVSIEAVYGGVSMMHQISRLRRGTNIVVGTTGRIMDHVRRGTLALDSLKTLVLDEADIMLDMGFKEDIDFILTRAPEQRSIWLFSATVKAGVQEIKDDHMKNVQTVRISPKVVTTKNTAQYYCVLSARDRLTALTRIIDCTTDFYAIIFVETKALAADLPQQLAKRGYKVDTLHGDMSQVLRDRVISKFKNKEINLLIATDVAARGIDIAGLSHVVNYSLPRDQESYVHRIGRTGRAGQQGCAISFITRSEIGRLKRLAQKFQADIAQMPIPTFQDAFEVRVKQALASVNELFEAKQHSPEMTKRLRPMIEAYSKEDLVNGMLGIMAEKFGNFDAYKQDLSAPHVEEREYGNNRRGGRGDRAPQRQYDDEIDENMRELMLNVGTMDGVNQQDVMNFILSSNKLKQKDIVKLRVIQKRSFFTVPVDYAKGLIHALDKKNFGGRKTHVSLASNR